MALYFNGGHCTEDVNDQFGDHLRNVRGMNVRSADTILRGIGELPAYTLNFDNPDTGVRPGLNLNLNLNMHMVKSLKRWTYSAGRPAPTGV